MEGVMRALMRRPWRILAVVAIALCLPAPAAAQAITIQEQTRTKGLWDPLLGMYVHTAATADVNGDGWADLFVGGFYKDMTWNRFFRYGDRGATQIAPDRLLLGGATGFTVDATFPEMRTGNSSGSVFADFDGDGDRDLLVSHYYPYHLVGSDPQAKAAQAGVIALRNTGGHFTLVGQPASGIAARALAVADFNHDRKLDFFVVEDIYSQDSLGPPSSRLYLGNNDLTFREATAASGIPTGLTGLAVVATDLNGDRIPDILISGTWRTKADPPGAGTFRRARLLVNDGTGHFSSADASVFTMVSQDWNDESAGIAVGDLNADGRPDIVIGAHPYPGYAAVWPQPIHIYLNRGPDANRQPRYRDVTKESGIGLVDAKTPHITLADMNNDGRLDLVTGVSVGNGTKPAIWRHAGIVNGVPRFTPPSGLFAQRTAPPTLSQWETAGVNRYWPIGVNADFNRDRKVDLFLGEWFPELPSRYFTNTTVAGGAILVDLTPPAQAFGALVKVYAVTATSPHTRGALFFSREVSSTESYGGGMLHRMHVGIGTRSLVDIEVVAPWTGRKVTLINVRPGQTVRITLSG
jgi:hypothetical protein